ncbi:MULTISPECIES: MmgE/PrpD family protein [Mumia]|uniref:MmgE/PrpD family protein n=1 Tax=Mumia TaxID=1546255 RepID=UPI0015FD5BB5|nr:MULTISPECIES: MmgE/PrpD family protein [unclassified Mumia]QMW66262.1 MmgE/PrpD family protein [Mumia sp. ZJ1417]
MTEAPARPAQATPAQATTEAETLGQEIARFAVSAARDSIPAAVTASAKQRILDVLGLCVAAHRLDTSAAIVAYVADQGGHAQASAVGVPDRVTAAQAALVNGVLAHSLDYDDTHLPSVLHPSASVVPATLAAAEHAGADGALAVRAAAVGIEVAVRLGMAGYDHELGNSVFFEHGQHATSITGAMGSAVAASLAYGADEQGVLDALGIAASMAAGIIEANRTGGTVKRLHCGFAAQAGVSAAQLVRHGFTGPPTVIEGRFGFLEAWLHGSRPNLDAVTEGLGTSWAVPDIFFKPYPANHFTHTSVDAGLALRARGVRPEDVASITIGAPTAVIRTIGAPLETKRAPQTGYQAQFSGPYAVVAGLLGGGGLGTGLDDYTDALAQDPVRRALMAKVDVVPDARCDAIYPHQFPAVVTVTTTSGETLVEEVLTNRGGPARPLTGDELARKFRDNVEGRLDEDAANRVRALVETLDEQPAVASVLQPLTALTFSS